jgi:hypothetical protein
VGIHFHSSCGVPTVPTMTLGMDTRQGATLSDQS